MNIPESTAEELKGTVDAPVAYEHNGVSVYRAFGVSKCLKALVAARLGYDQMPPTKDMQARFDDGHLHEPDILAKVAESGWSLFSPQYLIELEVGKGVIIRGHLDSLGLHPVHGLAVVEAKALSQSGYDKWLKNRWLDFPYYAEQVTVYKAATEAECIVMAVKNKNSGQVDITVHFEAPASLAKIKARILTAEKYAKRGELPADCDKSDYPCPVFYLHDEKPVVIQTVEQSNDAEVAELLAKHYQGAALEAQGKALKAEIRPRLLELSDGTAAGGYRLSRVVSHRKNLDRAAVTAAGIDLSAYETETPSVSLSVKEV